MSTFNDRKAERIAAMRAGIRCKFQVVEGRYDGKIVAIFDSRKSAERFADEQVSTWVGDTAAYRAWAAMQPRNAVVPTSTIFRVERVQA